MHVTRHHKKDGDYALSVRAHRFVQLARVIVRVIVLVVDVVLGPTTSVYEVNVNVVSAVTSCGVTYCATT